MIFHDLQFRATLTTILHTSQNPHVLHISGFPKIDTARRRERTSEMDLVAAPFRAGEMHFFDLDRNFSPRGSTNLPHTDAHTTDLHQMLFSYRKNPIVWPHCLGNIAETNMLVPDSPEVFQQLPRPASGLGSPLGVSGAGALGPAGYGSGRPGHGHGWGPDAHGGRSVPGQPFLSLEMLGG